MADDDGDELLLNTLDRFRKRSPRLLLEEYSHCEVPAGCGGVILRWVDPDTGVPAVLRVVIVGDGEASTWIDGVAVDSSRTTVAAGERVLAIELKLSAPCLLLVELQRGLGKERYGASRPVLTRSRGDGRWLAANTADVWETWTEPGFSEDREWLALAASDAVIPDRAKNSWQARMMRDAGSQALVVGDDVIHGGVARIRHRFFVEALDAEARREERG